MYIVDSRLAEAGLSAQVRETSPSYLRESVRLLEIEGLWRWVASARALLVSVSLIGFGPHVGDGC